MAKINQRNTRPAPNTANGAPAACISKEKQLSRLVACCMLWEDGFYESGKTVADRISELVPQCDPQYVADMATEARTSMKLRHAPLLLAREMAKYPTHKAQLSTLLPKIILRPDEITEFMAIYWKDGKTPIAEKVKQGLRAAFNNFNEFQLSKYNRDAAIRLRDVAMMVRVKADGDREKGSLYARLINKDTIPMQTKGSKFPVRSAYDLLGDNPGLRTVDTWETALSAGDDKKETWLRLMEEGKLGVMAFIRNLRNMKQQGVPKATVVEYADRVNIEAALPFRFLAAARAVPEWEDVIEPMMLKAAQDRQKLKGKTRLLVDVSGSMDEKVSAKSDITRLDAACGIAILLRELCEEIEVQTFSRSLVTVKPRRGFALRDAISESQHHGSTYLGAAVGVVNKDEWDRLVVITDEQSDDPVPAPVRTGKAYIINVASEMNGVGYGPWNHIDGWSETVIDYLMEFESI